MALTQGTEVERNTPQGQTHGRIVEKKKAAALTEKKKVAERNN